jgi:adenine deaminase
MSTNNNTFTISGVYVNPESRETFGCEMHVMDGKIVKIEPRDDIQKPYILPGFVDSHVHIESSMLIPSQFASMAVKHGSVAVVTDPHEVANVAGESGIRFMVDNAKTVPLKFFFGVPSCVPASPLEKSGATLNAKDIKRLIEEPSFYFLAEMMNFPGVVTGDLDVMNKLEATQNVYKPIDGHAPGLAGEDLVKYAKAGISTDHECSTVSEAVEKIQLGMKILIREGSAAKNFNNLIPLIKDYPKQVMFCTDDCHPDYLEKGHINKVVARAISGGYNLYDVLYAASINPILHYNLPVGRLRINDPADFIIVNDLENFNVLSTFINGEEVFSKGQVNFTMPEVTPPKFSFRQTANSLNLDVVCKGKEINVIGAVEGELITSWLVEKSPVNEGEIVKADPENDFLKIVLLDRYSEAEPVIAFIRGFGFKKGAIAASIAHDSHHILAVGCDDSSIQLALEWVISSKGGLCYAVDGLVEGISLPYFGLMTNKPGVEVSKQYHKLNSLLQENRSSLTSPFMTASFMALTVIPELKIYHNGLFDALNFEQVSLFK